MKINKRLSKSAAKMKDLGLYKPERKDVLKTAYSLWGRLTGKREKLEWELGNFLLPINGKTFYKERSGDPYFDAHFDSQEVSTDFARDVLYESVFG